MISLEQIRLLESRVEKAVVYIDLLQDENASLKSKLSGYEKRIQDLEVLVRSFQQDQGRIEEGILHALDRLNAFEDEILSEAEEKPKANAKKFVAEPAEMEPEKIRETAPLEELIPADEGEPEESQKGELDIF
jgi:FtsZ-binding cell division protein ZapB